MYDYLYSMIDDIKSVFNDYDWESDNRADLENEMFDKLWVDDSVTGNASGSYTCNSNIAKEYVIDNMDLLIHVCNSYGIPDDEVGKHFLNEDWEYFDCSIRCYILSDAISLYLDRYYDEFEEDESTYPAEISIGEEN